MREIGRSGEITTWVVLNLDNDLRSMHYVGLKCYQSCLVALAFCTKLYIKLAFFLCSFSQFSFPFNFRTAEALVLKFGPLPLYHLQYLVSDF